MKEKIKEMTIEEKVGQMFIIGINKANPMSLIEKYILQDKVGGILLYKRNYKNQEDLNEVINKIKNLNSKSKVPIFIATDQEGGRVSRMPKEFENIPSANSLAKHNEEDLVEQATEIAGKMLHELGFNLDFAPVLDIKRFPNGHAIGDRAYGEDKEVVLEKGRTCVKKLQEHNVLPIIKHFPGHGATTKDSHFGIPVIKGKDREILEKEDIYPFEKLINEGVPGVLVGHFRIEGKTNGVPATMSRKFVTKEIRKKYRYSGLIITDDMRMKSVKFIYGPKDAVKKAFDAGYDMIVLKGIEKDTVIQEIVQKVKKSPKKQARVNRSVNRILKAKEKFKITDDMVEQPEGLLEECNEKIKELRKKVGMK